MRRRTGALVGLKARQMAPTVRAQVFLNRKRQLVLRVRALHRLLPSGSRVIIQVDMATDKAEDLEAGSSGDVGAIVGRRWI